MTGLLHAMLQSVLLIQAPAAPSPAPAKPLASVDSVLRLRLAAGPEYRASSLKQRIFGSGWRDLWTTPVSAPLFDIDSYAGGLELKERGGGNQTLSLHFAENEGWRDYTFRSVNKFPLIQATLPELSGTLSGSIIQDQVSGIMPGAALLVAPLLDAVGILHVTPTLFVMPDDSRLGIWRDTFAVMLGTVEVNPHEAPEDHPGFAGSDKVLSGEKFLDAVHKSRAVRLDERELFAARLVDFLINDVDRTRDNIRFARFGDKGAWRWRPLPRDRDNAFLDARGWFTEVVMRPIYPKLTKFQSSMVLEALVFGTHHIDRQLLQRLTRADVDSISLRVQQAITNDVIEAVVAALPEPWRDATTAPARMRSVLRARRDSLPAIAHAFYAWLATEVDLHGTDEDERTVVERHDDGRVTVTITGSDDPAGAEPFIRRTFLPSETREVRVYLHGGNDVAVVRGSPSAHIIVRLIGGKGDDQLADSAGGGGTYLYDSEGDNQFIAAERNGTHVNTQPWTAPVGGGGVWQFSAWRPDWGGSSGWGPSAGYTHGAGVVLGFGPRYVRQGFRRLPHLLDLRADALISLHNWRPGVSAKADFRAENSPLALLLDVRATRFEEFNFTGFGNATQRLSEDRARVNRDLIGVEPSIVYQLGWRSRDSLTKGLGADEVSFRGLRPLVGKVEAGVMAYWTKTSPSPGSPFAVESSHGRDVEGRIGARLRIALDKTPTGDVPDRGFRLQSEVTGYPAIAAVNAAFGTASLTGTAYMPLAGNGMHLAVRAGAAAASPGVPLLNAPAVGGQLTVRGYDWRRFTGDRTAYGSAELRVPAGTLPLLIRWHAGVFGLADAGRVWFNGKSDGAWHTGLGGGLWLSALGQTFSIAYAHGEKGTIYLQKGASF